jgi:hypothetical protein
VAVALGVTRQWVARVEAGTGNPDVRQLVALCEQLGLQLTLARVGAARAGKRPASVRSSRSTPARPARAVPPSVPRGGSSPDVDLDQLLAGFTGDAHRRKFSA